MSGIAKLWLRAGVVLVVFWIIAWFLGSALGGSAGEEWLIRALLWVLGLVAAAMVVSVLAKSASQSSSLSPVEDELERAFATSKERLKPTGHTVATLPVVLLLGPEGSTKTSTIVQSGFEPDLLAGEVFRGQTVVPTPSANVWFSQNAVFVEAGGKLLGDSAGWARLIRHIRPQRLAAVFGGRPQAARVAVVCFSCEELVKPGGAQSAVQAAQSLREKLSDVSKRIGVRLPVYVLFTKVDRVPYFAEYVRRFSEEEVREVLGSTLRLVPAVAGGSYADREHQRLSDAFERLVQSLAKKRLDLLPREVDPLAQAGTYEFPREFR
ncbi:MAG: hypothetical protein O7F70_02885, partial [Gemmatimonadetes bacterium]|nr:hypothetical protein [Gemmatimonadota bacterium]